MKSLLLKKPFHSEFSFLFIKLLLRCNWHLMEHTHWTFAAGLVTTHTHTCETTAAIGREHLQCPRESARVTFCLLHFLPPTPPCPPIPSPVNHRSALSLKIGFHVLEFSVGLQRMYFFSFFCFRLLSRSRIILRFTHVVASVHSRSFSVAAQYFVWICLPQFITHQRGTSGHFWFEVIRNKVAMNTLWQVSVWTYAFLSTGWIFRRGLAGSWVGYVFTFLRNCAAVFQSGCTVLCLRCKGFPAGPTQFSDALCSRPSSLSAVHSSLVIKQQRSSGLVLPGNPGVPLHSESSGLLLHSSPIQGPETLLGLWAEEFIHFPPLLRCCPSSPPSVLNIIVSNNQKERDTEAHTHRGKVT